MWKFPVTRFEEARQGLKLCLGELRSFAEEEAFNLGFEEWLRVHQLEETREAL